MWHCRLGHPHALNSLFKSGLLPEKLNPRSDIHKICDDCVLAKSHVLPFNSSVTRTVSSFDLVHSDVWGPSRVGFLTGKFYYVTFIDDWSRFSWVYFLRHKSEVLHVFKFFCSMILTQFGRKIKIFRSDSGGEYVSNEFEEYLATEGIIHQRSCPHQPQQNGVAERKHRHIMETTRALLLHAQLPKVFWAESVMTSVYLINRLPSSVIGDVSPLEKLFGYKPNYKHLRIFGCTCYILKATSEYSKLDAKAARCIFLGYSENQKGYRCYDWDAKKIRISRNVVFLENTPYFSSSSTTTLKSVVDVPLSSFSNNLQSIITSPRRVHHPTPPSPTSASGTSSPLSFPQPTQTPSPPSRQTPPPPSPVRKSTRLIKPVDRLCLFSTLDPISVPCSYKKAADSVEWSRAMQEELDALQQNHTWDLVRAPPDHPIVGSKWVYSIKLKADGSLDRYKARLVAQGFNQEHRIDYDETFAPVAKMTTVRTLFAVASSQQWDVFQMDVKNAFLNGDLLEEVYMRPPPGFSFPPQMVCKLQKAIYGLKQAPRAWFAKLKMVLTKEGYTQSPNYYSLFLCKSKLGSIFVLVYVDDILITGNDS